MRIKCEMCDNELNRKCTVLKTTVNPTKSRKCNDYACDDRREIAKLERRAHVLDLQEAALIRKRTESHPVTGDLSRFKTTATK